VLRRGRCNGAQAAAPRGSPTQPGNDLAENRGGAGRGEFVLLDTPPLVADFWSGFADPTPIRSRRAFAEEFWLASNHDLVECRSPKMLGNFLVSLFGEARSAVAGDCLASRYRERLRREPEARVTFARAQRADEFDLLGPACGWRLAVWRTPAAAEAVLRSSSAWLRRQWRSLFELDEGGRRVAGAARSGVLSTSVPVYLTAFAGVSQAQSIHARDHIRRCGRPPRRSSCKRALRLEGATIDYSVSSCWLTLAQVSTSSLSLLDVDSRRVAPRCALRWRARARSQRRSRACCRCWQMKKPASGCPSRCYARSAAHCDSSHKAGAALAGFNAERKLSDRFLLLEPIAELAPHDPALRASLRRL